tara:strand:- start:1111 stop:1770 length:660 start_codon:yes stop_codon:yes gene_type:complete
MSNAKFASLHGAMLVRAQIGNGGFFPDAAGATPNVARLAATAKEPLQPRQPRHESTNVYTHGNFSPTPHRRAEVLPPGSVSVTAPKVQPCTPEPAQPAVFGARHLIAKADEQVSRWDREERQAEAQAEVRTQPLPQAQPQPQPQPVHPPVEHTAPHVMPPAAAYDGKTKRKAMTLRLPPAQHRALKLAAVRLDRTCQDIMAASLTAYLAELVGYGDNDD